MTETEWRRLVLQGLRAARRQYRRADTAGEVLERWLDRQIKRKTRTTSPQSEAILPLWERFRDQVNGLMKAISDFLGVARF